MFEAIVALVISNKGVPFCSLGELEDCRQGLRCVSLVLW